MTMPVKKSARRPRKVRAIRRDQTFSQSNVGNFGLGFPYGGLNLGGIVNPMSGMGTRVDKNEGIFYEPTRITTRTELEILYAQSWACKSFIDIPVDDMMIRWREFDDMDERGKEIMEKQELKFQVIDRLARAMKAGRLYGTGALVLMTAEAPMNEPFNLNAMRPGDLLNLLVLDRFDMWVTKREKNPYSQRYGSALEYGVNLKDGGTLLVHASRMLRFDGQKPISMTGWYNYEQDWGVSEVIPILRSIHQEEAIAAATGHLAQEAVIPIVKIAGYEDAISGNPEGNMYEGDMTIAQKAEAISVAKGVYRTMYMDKNDDFERNQISFSGLPELMDRHAKRLAGAERIPATRFWGQSPLGLNATGDGDMDNYALHVHAMQRRMLTEPLYKLDQVLARDAGIDEPLSYDWPSLIDMSDEQQAKTLDTKADAVQKLVGAGVIDENEAREILDGDPLVGTLEEIDEPILPQDPSITPLPTPEQSEGTAQKDSLTFMRRVFAALFDGPYGSRKTEGGIRFKPPRGARNNARKVLRWKEQHGDEVKGMTQVGWTRANQLASGELLTPETVARMSAFNRHRKNAKVDPKYKSEPWKDAGYVAWLGWGGDSGISWAKKATAWYKSRGKNA